MTAKLEIFERNTSTGIEYLISRYNRILAHIHLPPETQPESNLAGRPLHHRGPGWIKQDNPDQAWAQDVIRRPNLPTTLNNLPEFLSIREASVTLRITEHTTRKWARSGKFQGASKLGKHWRIPREAVLAMLDTDHDDATPGDPPGPPEFLSAEETAVMLGLTGRTVRKWLKAKRFQGASKLGKHWRIPRGAVLAMLGR